jgi:hypothetical protein
MKASCAASWGVAPNREPERAWEEERRQARTMAEQRLDSILKTSQANCPGLDDISPPLILSCWLRRFLYRRKAHVLCAFARRESLETNRQGARTNPRCQPWKEQHLATITSSACSDEEAWPRSTWPWMTTSVAR